MGNASRRAQKHLRQRSIRDEPRRGRDFHADKWRSAVDNEQPNSQPEPQPVIGAG